MPSSSRSRATHARVLIDPTLRASLVHLPASLCSTLIARNVVPQTLIVELGTEAQTYYGGWTGMSPNASVLSDPNASDCVVASPALASLFSPGLSDGTLLSIRLFRSPPVPIAQEVHVTPVSPDDWEILSVHAGEVEDNMLSQVRAAKQGQVLAVSVGRSASTVIKFVVDRTVPPTRPVNTDHSDEQVSASIAVRLSTDTEVIIAPNTRFAQAPEEEPTSLATFSSSAAPLTSHSAQNALSHVAWRVLPASYVPDDERDLLWAVVVPAAFAPPDTDRPAYELVALAFKHHKLCVTRVSCPSSVRDEDAPQNATASASFGPGTMPEEEAASLHIPWPERHVWIGASLRDKLGLQDLDLVTLSAPSPGAVREADKREEHKGVHLCVAEPDPLAGMDEPLNKCLDTVRVMRAMRDINVAEQGCMDVISSGQLPHPPRRPFSGTSGILLTGPSGSGKTSLARAVGTHLAHDPSLLYRLHIVDCAQFVEERMPLVRARCKEWLDEAAWHAPTLLVLDNLDLLMPADGEHVDTWRSCHLAHALVERIEETVRDYDVFVLATAQNASDVHAYLQNARVWAHTLSIKPPAKEARRQILHTLVQQVAFRAQSAVPELDYTDLVTHTDGYHVADLKMLTDRAVHEATIRCVLDSRDILLDMCDFDRAQEGYTPLSLRDVKLEQSATEWADIGGLFATRQTLRETLEWPTKYAAIFANCPLRLRSGLLLYGYPGCGKTLLASAVAKECGLNFISVKGPEILNKYIGASEKSVRDLFERAESAKPCVLFFDEFDSIAPKRGHDSTGVTDRVVNQLLTQMDGAEGLDGVYVLAATSRPDLIDAALLRPGRLDKSLLCDMPSRDDRVDILRAIARKVPLDADVNLDVWAQKTEGYSGADLQALMYNAQLEAINESLRAPETRNTTQTQETINVAYVSIPPIDDSTAHTVSGAQKLALGKRLERMVRSTDVDLPSRGKISSEAPRKPLLVHTSHLDISLRSTRPSVPPSEVARLGRIYAEFSGDRKAIFPDGTPSNQIGARTSLM